MSETHVLRLDAWLRIAPLLPRTDELVSPDGSAYCWLGGAALVASRDPASGIGLVIDQDEVESYFTVGDARLPDQHDAPLVAAMAEFYGVDLWDVAVEPKALPGWLGEEVAAALESAKHDHRRAKAFWMYAEQARLDGGWSLSALSDIGVATATLLAVTRDVLNLDRTAVLA